MLYLHMKICKVEKCVSKHKSKGYCRKHYELFKRNGEPVRKTESHKLTKTPEYKTWQHIKDRCFNKKNKGFKNYGGRGITVCDEWRESFSSFYRDMGQRPSKKHSIDRIDNEKGYYKDNCRWADRITQNNNQRLRKDNKSGFKGVCWDKSKNMFAAYISVNSKRILVGTFKTIKEAIEERKKAESKNY